MTSITRRRTSLAALVAVSLLLASCAASPTADGSPVGRWGDAQDEGTHLTLLDDGTVLGNDGCNGIGGKWKLIDDTVAFPETYMTLMECPGDDDWLGGLASAVVIGDLLHVLDSEGEEIGVLPRVPEVGR